MSFNTESLLSTKYAPRLLPQDLIVLTMQTLGSFSLINDAVSLVTSTTLNFSLNFTNFAHRLYKSCVI